MASCTTWRTVCFAARGTNRGGSGWGRTGGYAPPRRPAAWCRGRAKGWPGGRGAARAWARMAELQGGWEIFLQFAMEVGALSRAEKEQLQRRGEGALGDLAQRQAQYQVGSDPALRFVALVP